MASSFSSVNFGVGNQCKLLMVFGLVILFFILISHPNQFPNYSANFAFLCPLKRRPSSEMVNNDSWQSKSSPTNLSHLVFGLLGSERAWHHRKAYTESWWRPNVTRGTLYLDEAPKGDLLPWSPLSPPFRVSDDLTNFFQETKARAPIMIRMVHGIMEVFRDHHVDDESDVRWLVMGDDDSVFFVDNIVNVLAEYDHTKYYYLGGPSEFIMANYGLSFNQGYGGAGFMLSYPLAKALAYDMENCLRRYSQAVSADTLTMVCIADIGVNLSPHKGIHQIDLSGNISGFLSSHPKSPLLSLHHFDVVDPIFPNMDRFESTRHLMKAAAADQSRMLQQTICYHRQSHWSISVSWGYSVHIYETIFPRSYLQIPIETFLPWDIHSKQLPHYMFNTRLLSSDSCEAPHVFFFKNVSETASKGKILTTYSRVAARRLPPCGNHTADFVSEIRVFSPATERNEMDRCECCDIVDANGPMVELKFRECMTNEIIA